MLSRLLSLLILLAVIYLVVTQALPYLTGTGRSNDGPVMDSVDGRCLEQAVQVDDSLTRAARDHAQPPVDVDAWNQAVWEIESGIRAARTQCGCLSETCQAASRALDEMSSLLSNLDGMVRGDSSGFANPGRQQEKILDLLDRARAAAGN